MAKTFNLICHGMMAYVEEEFHFRILMPEIKVHDYSFGIPQPNAQPKLYDLPPGSFQMTGIPTQPSGSASHLDPGRFLVLHRSRVDPISNFARFSLLIPKPYKIDLYREVDLSDKPPILGNTPPHTVANYPTHLHDVVVFRYTGLDSKRTVEISNWYAKAADVDLNLCLYCQTGLDHRVLETLKPHLEELRLGHPDSAVNALKNLFKGSGSLSHPDHLEGLNHLLRVAGTSKHLDLQLSNAGRLDTRPSKDVGGLQFYLLWTLKELLLPLDRFLTVPGGCSGVGTTGGS